MYRQLLLFVSALLVFTAASNAQDEHTQGDGETIYDMPTNWDTFYAVVVKQGPNHADDTDPAVTQAIMHQHIQYQLGLQHSGTAVAAGGFADASDGISGLTLLRAESLEDAERIANSDPAVQAGRFSVVVKTWYVPGGRL
ncbi:YciI family protein [Aliidiomarina soli]|uniref:YCII-related domain-containing protein n=1 Tax=Aliidiomarina soli TaxID=1928574 RepID=A0A432WLV5_9GAMM|nr:YciI family protein [Aliidiomarina soli]RUO34802.1 hypothetical protein CWE14_02045 [Aliidiomarina soli]